MALNRRPTDARRSKKGEREVLTRTINATRLESLSFREREKRRFTKLSFKGTLFAFFFPLNATFQGKTLWVNVSLARDKLIIGLADSLFFEARAGIRNVFRTPHSRLSSVAFHCEKMK